MKEDQIKIYYADTLEDQPLDSSAIEQAVTTGSSSNKSASSDSTIEPSDGFPARPVPIPVVAKELISDSLNTQSRQILSNFTFSRLGAIQVGEYVNGVSGDLRITSAGLAARNTSGTTTVSIDGETGDATFLGTVAAGSVISASIAANQITGTIVDAQIATISWAKITSVAIVNADIVSLSADKITTGSLTGINIAIGSGNDIFKADSNGIYLGHASFSSAPFRVNMDGDVTASSLTLTNASIGSGSSYTGNQIAAAYIGNLTAEKITSGDLTSITITGVVITGGTIRTASSGSRVEMNGSDNEMAVYNSTTKIIQVDEGGMWVRQDRVIGLGGTSAAGQTVQIYYDSSSAWLALDSNGGIILNAGGSISIGAGGVVNIGDVDAIGGSSGNIDFNESGRIEVSTHLDPDSAGSNNLGGSSRYWGDVSYKTLTDRGCLGWFDDGVELQDGSIVSDLEAIKRVKKHETKKTIYGVPMLDYASLPKAVYKKAADHDGVEFPRDLETDEPLEYKEDIFETIIDKKGRSTKVKVGERVLKPQDGAETTALISIMFGAIKELSAEVEALKVLVNK